MSPEEEILFHEWRLAQEQQVSIPADVNALSLLQMVYRGQVKLTPQQLRAAEAALPYENPRLSAIAVGQLGDGFGARLERAIFRSQQVQSSVRLIEDKRLKSQVDGRILAQKVEATKQEGAQNHSRGADGARRWRRR